MQEKVYRRAQTPPYSHRKESKAFHKKGSSETPPAEQVASSSAAVGRCQHYGGMD